MLHLCWGKWDCLHQEESASCVCKSVMKRLPRASWRGPTTTEAFSAFSYASHEDTWFNAVSQLILKTVLRHQSFADQFYTWWKLRQKMLIEMSQIRVIISHVKVQPMHGRENSLETRRSDNMLEHVGATWEKKSYHSWAIKAASRNHGWLEWGSTSPPLEDLPQA